MPDFPWRRALVQVLEALLVLESVHALPESRVLVGQQGLLFNQALKRPWQQIVARVNITEDFVAHGEETTVDPNVGAADWASTRDCSLQSHVDNVKAPGGLYHQHGSNGIAVPESLQHTRKREIAQSVAI